MKAKLTMLQRFAYKRIKKSCVVCGSTIHKRFAHPKFKTCSRKCSNINSDIHHATWQKKRRIKIQHDRRRIYY